METAGTVHTVPETAKQLRLSERYVWHLIATGELPHMRVGRRVLVTDGDITAFCAAHKVA